MTPGGFLLYNNTNKCARNASTSGHVIQAHRRRSDMSSVSQSTTICGVYKITNNVNGKFYIGSSVNIISRWSGHLSDLNKNKHHSRYLQRAWNKYGADYFSFEIIEQCEKSQLIAREQHYFDTKKPQYNILPKAGSCLGSKHSEERRRKNSLAKIGNTFAREYMRSEEARKKFSKIHKGKILSEETRAKISAVQIGRKASDETKAKMSAVRKGICTNSREHFEKLSLLYSGKPLSDDHKKKLSEAHMGNTSAIGHKVSDEARARISESLKKHYQKQKEEGI